LPQCHIGEDLSLTIIAPASVSATESPAETDEFTLVGLLRDRGYPAFMHNGCSVILTAEDEDGDTVQFKYSGELHDLLTVDIGAIGSGTYENERGFSFEVQLATTTLLDGDIVTIRGSVDIPVLGTFEDDSDVEISLIEAPDVQLPAYACTVDGAASGEGATLYHDPFSEYDDHGIIAYIKYVDWDVLWADSGDAPVKYGWVKVDGTPTLVPLEWLPVVGGYGNAFVYFTGGDGARSTIHFIESFPNVRTDPANYSGSSAGHVKSTTFDGTVDISIDSADIVMVGYQYEGQSYVPVREWDYDTDSYVLI
jgi:hypothetical protein